MASDWLEQLGNGVWMVRAIGSWYPIGQRYRFMLTVVLH